MGTYFSNLRKVIFLRKRSNLFLAAVFVAAFAGCDSDAPAVDVSEVERETELRRFDRDFFASDTSQMPAEIERLAKRYPEFFAGGKNPRFWKAQRTDENQLALYEDIQNVFGDASEIEENLNFSMKHFYWYFPDNQKIKFYGYVSNLDFDYPVLFADSVCFVGLDLYLGPKKPFYQSQPEYLAFFRQPAFLVRDVMEAVCAPKITRNPESSTLLDDMVYYGKVLYFLEKMLPQKEPKIILKYPQEKLEFIQENERNIWAYFIENNLLFDSSLDAKRRFVELAPFSKFRAGFDKETPGMVGRWVGLQIVRGFMENEKISLQELGWETDARKILKLSGYKP